MSRSAPLRVVALVVAALVLGIAVYCWLSSNPGTLFEIDQLYGFID